MLVRGASRLAIAARISPLVVGLTVVAYGTSSPELAVSIQASLSGQTDIAVGNVVGSNICNVLLILGMSALVAPLVGRIGIGRRLWTTRSSRFGAPSQSARLRAFAAAISCATLVLSPAFEVMRGSANWTAMSLV